MKITIESTSKIVEVNGVPGRLWEGKTENGIQVCCLITRIAAKSDEDQSQFQQELVEQKAPSPALDAFPLRMVL